MRTTRRVRVPMYYCRHSHWLAARLRVCVAHFFVLALSAAARALLERAPTHASTEQTREGATRRPFVRADPPRAPRARSRDGTPSGAGGLFPRRCRVFLGFHRRDVVPNAAPPRSARDGSRRRARLASRRPDRAPRRAPHPRRPAGASRAARGRARRASRPLPARRRHACSPERAKTRSHRRVRVASLARPPAPPLDRRLTPATLPSSRSPSNRTAQMSHRKSRAPPPGPPRFPAEEALPARARQVQVLPQGRPLRRPPPHGVPRVQGGHDAHRPRR